MRARGFTMLELILVIVITGILAVVVAPIIRQPIRAYFDQTTRAELVDSAEMALRRMARDVRLALPYSLRPNAAATAVEFINVVGAARYRRQGGNPLYRLSVGAQDTDFNTLGQFLDLPLPLPGGEQVVVFNLGINDFNSYAGDPVITPATTTVAITVDGTEHHVSLGTGHEFGNDSPSRRVYIVRGASSYACFNGGLYRASGYAIDNDQLSPANVAATGVLMADGDADCTFSYDAGNSTRPGLLMMRLTLTRGGESVTLLHQVHVPNAT